MIEIKNVLQKMRNEKKLVSNDQDTHVVRRVLADERTELALFRNNV